MNRDKIIILLVGARGKTAYPTVSALCPNMEMTFLRREAIKGNSRGKRETSNFIDEQLDPILRGLLDESPSHRVVFLFLQDIL